MASIAMLACQLSCTGLRQSSVGSEMHRCLYLRKLARFLRLHLPEKHGGLTAIVLVHTNARRMSCAIGIVKTRG